MEAIEVLSFVDQNRNQIIATLRFWLAKVKDNNLLLLGLIAVLPEFQDQGIGINLMFHGMIEATRLGYTRVLLIGE